MSAPHNMTPAFVLPAMDAEPDCPMARLSGFILRASAFVEELDDDEADTAFAETMAPAFTDFYHRTPQTRSLAGAALALRVMLAGEDLEETDARVLSSVLAVLERAGSSS